MAERNISHVEDELVVLVAQSHSRVVSRNEVIIHGILPSGKTEAPFVFGRMMCSADWQNGNVKMLFVCAFEV